MSTMDYERQLLMYVSKAASTARWISVGDDFSAHIGRFDVVARRNGTITVAHDTNELRLTFGEVEEGIYRRARASVAKQLAEWMEATK